MFGRIAIVAALAAHTSWAAWSLAANPHFEVYAQAGPESARASLAWLERLRGWLIRETGLEPDRMRPARVIGFATGQEYAAFRLRASADAYYIGTEGRDYIVMVMAGARAPAVAAHEYAHMALHSAGLHLPPWLGEGLADVFAEAAGGGAADRAHLALLRRRAPMPLADLLRLTAGERERLPAEATSLFYAESWALTSMLAFAPEYRGHLRTVVALLAAGNSGASALATVYGQEAAQFASDLDAWIARGAAKAPIALPPAPDDAAAVSGVAPERMRVLLATLLLDAGERDRAAAIYRDLPPLDGDAQAGLGLLALYAGHRDAAREHWRRAVALGTTDDALCYRYAMLAESAGAPAAEVRAALERAVAIRPDFDDARFHLAIIHKNEGRFDESIAQLRAMRQVAPARAFAYWSALSDALNSAGRFAEAENAAETAARHAATAEERARAAEQAWIARSEVVVQLQPDASGRPRMVTARLPRGRSDWNPFIDPRDDVRRAQGVLREIECGGGAPLRFVVETADGRIALAVPDPARVQMKNAPEEFTCGPQEARSVSVVYAAREGGGVLRGIEFR